MTHESAHSAQVLGIQGRKGSLEFLCDADFVLLDDMLHVRRCYIGGELVWAHEEEECLQMAGGKRQRAL